MFTDSESEEKGALSRLGYWIEYPFTATEFPWVWAGLVLAIIALVIFFFHDGTAIIAEHIGEVIPQ